MPAPVVLCGLAPEGLPGAEVALGAEDLLDSCRAERADEFVLQILGAYVDVLERRLDSCQAAS